MLNNKKEITIMKKTYQKPTTKVVQIQHRQMLCGSPYDDQKSLNVYDDEDVIDQKGYIW